MKPRQFDTHTPLTSGGVHAEAAVEAYLAGIAAVDPTVIVRKYVRQGHLDDWFVSREKPKQIHVLALGKAAPRMLWGLVEAAVPFKGMGVAPKGVPAPNVDTFTWFPGDHPLPGADSFAAGKKILEWARAFPQGEPLLVLLSGGASSCLEVPVHGVDAENLVASWKEWMAGGLSIEELNRKRSGLSDLKAGRLGKELLARTKNIRVWLLADTDPTTAPGAVGSGPFFQPDQPEAIPHQVLASVHDLIVAAGLRLGALGYAVYRHGARIAGPVEQEVDEFLAAAHGLPTGAALVGGGEATVQHPIGAPPGGRCQHGALAAAKWLKEHDSKGLFLAAASDGRDGETDAAGAIATAQEWDGDAAQAYANFDAHSFLDKRGKLVHMGATGTNVNDLWIAIRTA